MKDPKRTDEFHEIKWTPDKIARLWDYYADNPSYAGQYFSCHSGVYILNQCRKYVSFTDKDVLDFGCGTGHLIKHLLKTKARRVYGMDFSQESFNAVNRKFSGKKNFSGAVRITDFPSTLKNNSIDVVMAVEVIEHLDDPVLDSVLKEIYRLLRPGSRIVITTPFEEDLEASKTVCPECGCMFHRWQHIRQWGTSSIIDLTKKHGFKKITAKATVFGNLPKRLFYLAKKISKKCDYPHLLYVGEK